ncbi:MAG: metal-dependent transcriptional regulator [Bacteroidetes bacterium]|nr:metal-dependent transcriptional regulator [Bacteroidota bacterium]
MISTAEENYLKAVFKLETELQGTVPTGALAQSFNIQAPSVTDMVKKLASKKLLRYEKSKGVRLTDKGRKIAVAIVRKHRIWETFLVQTLEFRWDEVHALAEQLEHVHSEELIDRLDTFLGHPKIDPHGDPIPDKNGKIQATRAITLKMGEPGNTYKLIGIREDSIELLQFLNKLKIGLGSVLFIEDRESFDQSLRVKVDNKAQGFLSAIVANALLVVDA